MFFYLMFSKLVGKVNFSERKFEEKTKRYIWENVSFGIIIFSCLSSTKSCLIFLLNCFVQEIKGFYQSFLGNEVDFGDVMIFFPNILTRN